MITREELQKLSLSDDQIDAVMKLRGADAKAAAEAEELRQQVTALTTEKDGLKEQINSRDKDLKELQKKAKDSDELTSQLESLQTKYNEDTETLNAQLATTKLSAALTSGLANSGARDVDDLRRFLNQDDLKLSDEGKVIGLDDQVKALRESKPYLFQGEPTPHYTPTDGNASGGSITNTIKNPEANLTEALKAIKGE